MYLFRYIDNGGRRVNLLIKKIHYEKVEIIAIAKKVTLRVLKYQAVFLAKADELCFLQ